MSFQNPNVHISIHTSQPDRRKLNQTPHYHHAPMPVFSRLIFAVAFLSVLLEIDATGGVGFIEEAHDDSYNDFFQSLQQSLPSQLHGFHFPSLFLARRLLNVISRRRPPPDESVPQEGSKHGFFSRRARSNSSQELATMMPNQPVPEGKGGKGKQLEHETVDHVSAVSTLAQCHRNSTVVSAVPHTIRSAPQRTRANSEMILKTTAEPTVLQSHSSCQPG
ncbi:hypothetical protein BDR03DRAFT_314518 [Suillus americanus]|nr:hypothetical protein BDR03DRAFT_314518 [Suillus americanus]